MSDYNTLVNSRTTEGSIKNLVNAENVPAASIVTKAEAWIYRRLRIREMITNTTGTLTTSVDTIPLPADFRDPVFFMFTPTGTTAKSVPTYKKHEFVLDQFAYDGTGARVTARPRYYSVAGTVMQMESPADQSYPWRLDFYRPLPALGTATASSTNVLTSRYPDVLDATCTFFAYEWLRNEREKVYWRAVAEREIKEASREADLVYTDVDLQMEVE